MAGIFDRVKSVVSGVQSFIGTHSDDKDATASKDTTAVKRGASPQDPEGQAHPKRARAQISSVDKILVPQYSSRPAPHANQWDMNSRKKPIGGNAFRPRNDLNKPNAAYTSSPAAQLQTFPSVGSNVGDRPAKRQRTDEHVFQELEHDSRDAHRRDDRWFERDAEPAPATLPRQPSIISVHSQGQANSSQDARFRNDAFNNVNKTLARPRKARKPKPSASQEQWQPATSGTMAAPLSLDEDDDDDDIQVTGYSRSARKPSVQKSTRAFHSSPVRPSLQEPGEISGYFNHRLEKQQQERHKRDVVVEIQVDNSNRALKPSPVKQPSPRLGNAFIRDNSEPLDVQIPQPTKPSLRAKMQSASAQPSAAQTKPTRVDSSEDELAREDHSVHRPAQKNTAAKRRLSLSPHDIPPSFPAPKADGKKSSRKRAVSKLNDGPSPSVIPLKSLIMQCVELTVSTSPMLMFIPQQNRLGVQNKGETIETDNGKPLFLEGQHAQKLFYSTQESNGLLLIGAMDSITGSRVWFDFPSREHRDECIEAIKSIASKAEKVPCDDIALQNRLRSSQEVWEKRRSRQDPELKAMQNRQDNTNRGITARDRARAAQQGIDIPEPEDYTLPAPTPRKSVMKANFSREPTTTSTKSRPLPSEVCDMPLTSTRSSRRIQNKEPSKTATASKPEVITWTKIHGKPEWDAPLTYPATGQKRTTVEAEDIERLDEGGFLNDNLISFCLRYLEENTQHLKDQVHMFNSFFYTSFTTKSGKRALNYEGVKRWTKNIDIFTYPFVVVPVNNNLHWYLLIICNLDKLERTLKTEDEDSDPINQLTPPTQDLQQSQKVEHVNELEIPESPQDIKDEALSQGVGRMSLDVNGAAPEDDGDLPSPRKLKPVSRKIEKKQGSKVDTNAPIIITLDSLGSAHSAEIKHLKEYVVLEGEDKRGLEFEYNVIKGMTARGIPQQTNFCDCGVYLLGYVEELLKDPAEFVRKVITRELDLNNDFADFDPSKKREQIRKLLLELAEEQRKAKKAHKKAAHLAKKHGSQTPSGTATSTVRSSPMKAPAPRSSPLKSSPPLRSSPSRPSASETTLSMRPTQPEFGFPTKGAEEEEEEHEEMLLDNNPHQTDNTGFDNFSAELVRAANHAGQAQYEG